MPSEPHLNERLRDVDALLASLRTPSAPRPAPAWEAEASESAAPSTPVVPPPHHPWTRWAGIGAGLALSAVAAFALVVPSSDEPGFRGSDGSGSAVGNSARISTSW